MIQLTLIKRLQRLQISLICNNIGCYMYLFLVRLFMKPCIFNWIGKYVCKNLGFFLFTKYRYISFDIVLVINNQNSRLFCNIIIKITTPLKVLMPKKQNIPLLFKPRSFLFIITSIDCFSRAIKLQGHSISSFVRWKCDD